MGKLSELPNIGREIEKQLLEVGIVDPQQLKEVGSKQAWLDIKTIDPSACYNRLCALEGAIQGIRWHYLAAHVKQDLKAFYNDFKL